MPGRLEFPGAFQRREMEKDYAAEIRKYLTRYGFDDLDQEHADDILESIEGFITDLAHCSWDYEVWRNQP